MNKKLYLDTRNKKICGVCAGIARYFDLDPTVIRLAWILFSCLGGSGILAYLICAVVIPTDQHRFVEE